MAVVILLTQALGAGNVFLPGDEDMLTLDSSLTATQRALLGCGPFFGTRCDTSIQTPGPCQVLGVGCSADGGMDFLNMEAGAIGQSIVGFENLDLANPTFADNADHPEWSQWAAGGTNFAGTAEFADTGIWLTTSGLPQPGTIDFPGMPPCTRVDEETGETIYLPGCRGINGVLNRDTAHDDGFVTFRFDDGFDARVDGCPLGETIDGVPVRGVYRDGSPVNLNSCFANDDSANPPDPAFSTRKSGWYYVWPQGSTDADFPGPFPLPSLVDWNRISPNASRTSRDGPRNPVASLRRLLRESRRRNPG